MASAPVCSIDSCKRASACLCHHCNQNVCFKHLSEHQVQINNELLPLTDRLNELKMKLQSKNDKNGTLDMLKMWRDKKYKEIDEEYNRRVQEFDIKVFRQNEQVSQIITKIEELINEGEVSYEQIKQLKKNIEIVENQVKQLVGIEQIQIPSENTTTEFGLVNTYIQFHGQTCLVKGRVCCGGKNLYALESEKAFSLYSGVCPQCTTAHFPLHQKRGFYVRIEDLHEYVKRKIQN